MDENKPICHRLIAGDAPEPILVTEAMARALFAEADPPFVYRDFAGFPALDLRWDEELSCPPPSSPSS